MLTKFDGSWPGQRINMLCITFWTMVVLFGILTPRCSEGVHQPTPVNIRTAMRQRSPSPQLFRDRPQRRPPAISDGPAPSIRRRTNQLNQDVPFGMGHFQNGGHPFQANNVQPSNRQQRGLLSSAATSQIFAALKPGAPRPNSQQLNAMIQHGLAMHGLPKNTPLSRLIPLVMKEIKSGRVTPAMIQAAMSSMSSMQLPAQNPSHPPRPPSNNANFISPQHQQQQHHNHHIQQQQQQQHMQQQQDQMHHERQMLERHQRELQAKQQQEEHERRQREERERHDRDRFEREQQERHWHEKRQQDERRHHEQQLHHQHHNQHPHQQPHQLPFRNHQQNQQFNLFPPNNLRLPPQTMNHIEQQQTQQHTRPSRPNTQGQSHDHIGSEAAMRPQSSNHNPVPLPDVSNAIVPPMMSNHAPVFNSIRPHPDSFNHNNHHQIPHLMNDMMNERPLPIPPKPFSGLNIDLFKTMPSVPSMDDGPWIPLTRAPDRDWKPSDARWYMAGSSSSASTSVDLDDSGIPRSKDARSPSIEENNAANKQRNVTPLGEMTLAPPTDGDIDDEMMDVLNAQIPRGQQKEQSLKTEDDISNSQESSMHSSSLITDVTPAVDHDRTNDIAAWQEEQITSPKEKLNAGTLMDVSQNSSSAESQAQMFAATAEPSSSTEILAYHSTTTDSSETDQQPPGQISFSSSTMLAPHHEAVVAVTNDNRDDQSAIVSDTLLHMGFNGEIIQNTSWGQKTEAPHNPMRSTWYHHETNNVHRLPSNIAVAPNMDKEAHPWSPDQSLSSMNDGKLLYDHRHQKAEMTSSGYLAVPVSSPEIDTRGGQFPSSTTQTTIEFDPTREPHQPPTLAESDDLTGAFPAFSIEDLASFSKHPLLEEHLPMLRKNNLSHLSVDQLLEHWQNKFDMSYPDAKSEDDIGSKMTGDSDHEQKANTPVDNGTNSRITSERSAQSSPNEMHSHFPTYKSTVSHQFLQQNNQNSNAGNQSDSSTSLLTSGYQAALDLRPSDWSRRNHDDQASRGQRDTGGPSTSQPDPTSGHGVERQIFNDNVPTTPSPSVTTTLPYGKYVKTPPSSRINQSTTTLSPTPSIRPWHQRRNNLYDISKKNLAAQRRREDPLDQAPASRRNDVTGLPSATAADRLASKHQSLFPQHQPSNNDRESFVGTIDAAAVLSSKIRSPHVDETSGTVPNVSRPTFSALPGKENLDIKVDSSFQIEEQLGTSPDRGSSDSAPGSAFHTNTSELNATTEAEGLINNENTPKRKLTRFLVRRKKIRTPTTSSSFVKNVSSALHASPEMAYSDPLNA